MNATMHCVDSSKLYVIECDVLDVAISAILNQCRWPVVFMSQILNHHKTCYPAIKKEATVLIEAVTPFSIRPTFYHCDRSKISSPSWWITLNGQKSTMTKFKASDWNLLNSAMIATTTQGDTTLLPMHWVKLSVMPPLPHPSR